MALESTAERIVHVAGLQLPFTTTEHTPGANDKARVASAGNNFDTSCQEEKTAHPAEIEDDDVQFVFSVPKRRRKKRKRTEYTCNSASGMQDSKVSRCLPSSISSSSSPTSPILRRGSTGMVQLLESCHMGDNIPFARKSGSVPTISQCPQEQQKDFRLDSTGSHQVQLQQIQASSSTDELPWWDTQTAHAEQSGSFHFDICGMPFAEEILKKRKYDEERKGQELGSDHLPSQHSPNKRATTKHCSGLHGLTSDTFTGLNFDISSRDWQSTPISRQSSAFSPPKDFMESQRLSKISQGQATIDQGDDQNPLQSETHQSVPLEEASFSDWTQQQFVQVPVSLLRELSVSPRTKTVPILRQADLGMLQFHETPSQPSTATMTAPLNTVSKQWTVSYGEPFSSFNIQDADNNIPYQAQNHLPPLETITSDILRKPSLYKIPPWPASPVPLPLQHNFGDNELDIQNGLAHSLASHTQVVDSRNTGRPTVNTSTFNGVVASDRSNGEQVSVSIVRKGTGQAVEPTKPVFQIPSKPFESNHGSSRIRQPIRKYSPNLIVDIAETCQENFPFAVVAERHKQPIQKVFDTFSAIIQLPLLRFAADNRRHGDLAKSRMKEFRDAKKAMDKAQQLKRKVLKETGKADMDDLSVQKRPKKALELLKAAILNNARSKENE